MDDFILAVERANAAIRKLEPDKAPIEYTFESFMKFMLHERHKAMEQTNPLPSQAGPRPGPKGKGKRAHREQP